MFSNKGYADVKGSIYLRRYVFFFLSCVAVTYSCNMFLLPDEISVDGKQDLFSTRRYLHVYVPSLWLTHVFLFWKKSFELLL